ncbi:C-type lectin domain family 4 member M-like [Pomacea canaliculata]|uniref:C-type lectin domain family 4 member M-like n=1 Tax=Pomacea canaliculata TaxID=400727 RepID=UPI000D73627F|nr:C-type lectin domain family 4 member M-like [Pomacea canaliculata]XP_025089318.1 C-type lectin domain family 4 member M-like [Pomacea canaliculata]XP_025089319.1 C-type lectin domain family 4 member M-like [Pomacea canaliculata]
MTLTWFTCIIAWGGLFASLQWVNAASGAESADGRPRMLTKCKGDNVVLNEESSEVSAHVFVFRNGESVASTSVAAKGDLEGRLLVGEDSRVTVTNLTSSDVGLYRVEVKLSDGSATHHSTIVVVGEPPETTDSRLTAFVNTSDDNFIRLSCGAFMFSGFPPVSVIWKDPVGQMLASTGFSEKYFTLDLDTEVARPGLYSCQLDCRHPSNCCLDDQSPLRQWANIEVQTNKVSGENKKSREEDYVPVANFSSLVRRVQELEVAMTAQDCKESGVAAMAHLVHRQAKCDQLDTLIVRLSETEKKISDMENVSRIIKQMQDELNLVNHTLKLFQLHSEDDMKTVNQSFNNLRLQSEKETMDIKEKLKNILSKQQRVEDRMSTFNERMTQVNETMSETDDRISSLTDWRLKESDYRNQLTGNLSAVTRDVTVLRTETHKDMATVRSRISDIDNALSTQVKRSDATHSAIYANLSSLTRMAKQPAYGGCPVEKGYVLYNKRCLKLYTIGQDYQTARRRCQADGAHLFHFKSREEDGPPLLMLMDTNGQQINPKLGQGLWIGADDIVTEGNFLWSDGTPLIRGSPLWSSGQPDDAGRAEDCVEIAYPNNFVLNDFQCVFKLSFVCQADVNM